MSVLNKVYIRALFIAAISCSTAYGQQRSQSDVSMVDSLMSVMTLDEKIGQMNLLTSDWDVTGPSINPDYLTDIKKGKVGSIFNAYTVAYNKKVQRMAVEETRLGIPLLFGYDVIHGFKTVFPIPLAESASWDLEAIEESARVSAIEASAQGLHWTFAPMVDISRDPRWGRVMEGSGEDTYLTTLIGAARVRGFQGKNLSDTNTIIACMKHYAAYGAAQAGRDYHTVDISERTLRETYLPPFKGSVDAGVATVMTSFNELNGIPASGNAYLLQDILKDEWGFDGFVVTDYTSINEMVPHGFATDLKDAARLSANAGVDMDMQGGVYSDHLAELIAEGKVSMEVVNESTRRILEMKHQLGLFDDPYKYFDENREEKLTFAKEHIAKAKEVATKSIVLLKNENTTLPLKKEQKIALIGPLARGREELMGAWSGAGDWKACVTLEEGLQHAGAKFEYVKGCDIVGSDKSYFKEAIRLASKSDVIVLALGENRNMSGEAASRTEITLPGVQSELLQALTKVGKPIVLVLMNGRPLALENEVNWADAILETWFLGTTTGEAIADVLFGKYNPSGKLPITFPRSLGQVPIFYNNKNTGRPISESKYTSKYIDQSNDPLFSFGHGLSYTEFEYSKVSLSKKIMTQNDSILASVSVKNTGNYDGVETVQLYIQDQFGSVTRPVKELKAFRQVGLKKGEEKKISFWINRDKLSFLKADMTVGAEAGDFNVHIGTSSSEVKSAPFTLVE